MWRVVCVFLLFVGAFVPAEGGFWRKKTGTVFYVAETIFGGMDLGKA